MGESRFAFVKGDGDFAIKVAGTLHYQDEIERFAGGKHEEGAHLPCNVALVPEPSNPHDPDAVAVFILHGKAAPRAQVGYLPANIAPLLKRSLLDTGYEAASCCAKVVGGWDRGKRDQGSFGIRLDAFLPFDLIDFRSAPIRSPQTSDSPKLVREPVDIPAGFFKPEQRARQRSRLRGKALVVIVLMLVVLLAGALVYSARWP